MELSFAEYVKLRDCGMFYEWFPQCTGYYEEDKEELERVLPMFNALPSHIKDVLD